MLAGSVTNVENVDGDAHLIYRMIYDPPGIIYDFGRV